MEIYLDTASLEELRRAAALGVVGGVTTNPSLIAREKAPLEERIRDICLLVDGPVSAEVVSTQAGAMVEEGRRLAAIHPNVVVKCPVTRDGIQACAALARAGIRVNVTLVFSAAQALLAARAGAWCVSPFVGRIDDAGASGLDLIRSILRIYANYRFETRVLAASIRSPLHVVGAAEAGAHIATMPFKVFDQMFDHPLTAKGLAQFLSDYGAIFGTGGRL